MFFLLRFFAVLLLDYFSRHVVLYCVFFYFFLTKLCTIVDLVVIAFALCVFLDVRSWCSRVVVVAFFFTVCCFNYC